MKKQKKQKRNSKKPDYTALLNEIIYRLGGPLYVDNLKLKAAGKSG
ncbi:MAG: hypothetical protein KDD37_05190 [Bdellovibrionales bacterium]|nr:hypothetical protein [Bdellovibrionales bacterium]